MQHWSVNTKKYEEKDPDSYAKWSLINQINNGLKDGVKLSVKQLEEHWASIRKDIDPYKARAVEYLLWGKQSSLPTNLNFWSWLGKSRT